MCGPFSSVLRTLREELVKGVYSWHYASDKGQLVFDQVGETALCARACGCVVRDG